MKLFNYAKLVNLTYLSTYTIPNLLLNNNLTLGKY